MIQLRSIVPVADNSGARKIGVIRVLKGHKGKYGEIGDIIVGSVKEAEPRKAVKKSDIVHALIIRQRKPFRRKDGSYVRFDDNAVVVVEGKEPKPNELVELIEEAKKHNIKVIFVAPQFSQKSAQTISKSIGANVIAIDPLTDNWNENLLKVAKEIVNSYK